MHDEERRIVDIELYRLEETDHSMMRDCMSIDRIFAFAIHSDLARDAYLSIGFLAGRRSFFIAVIECNSDAGLREYLSARRTTSIFEYDQQ